MVSLQQKANRTVMLRLSKEDGDRVHHFAKGLNRLVSNLRDLQKGKKDGLYDSLVLWNTYLKKKKPPTRVHSKLICNEGISIDFLS